MTKKNEDIKLQENQTVEVEFNKDLVNEYKKDDSAEQTTINNESIEKLTEGAELDDEYKNN